MFSFIPFIITIFSFTSGIFHPASTLSVENTHTLAMHEMSLEKRYANESVNNVFKDNILLTISYMKGDIPGKNRVHWENITKPFHYEFIMKPHENFAFHNDVLAEYQGKITQTTGAHFNFDDGFKSDGYLFGDGVCHLASLMYWVAKDAGLDAKAPVNHNFANIPEIPKKFGVAIYNSPTDHVTSEQQNLYITNNKEHPVTFIFDYQNNILTIKITEKG